MIREAHRLRLLSSRFAGPEILLTSVAHKYYLSRPLTQCTLGRAYKVLLYVGTVRLYVICHPSAVIVNYALDTRSQTLQGIIQYQILCWSLNDRYCLDLSSTKIDSKTHLPGGFAGVSPLLPLVKPLEPVSPDPEFPWRRWAKGLTFSFPTDATGAAGFLASGRAVIVSFTNCLAVRDAFSSSASAACVPKSRAFTASVSSPCANKT